MAITIDNVTNNFTGGSGSSQLDFNLSVNTGSRAIVCITINDYLLNGIGNINLIHNTFINQMSMTRVTSQTVPGSSGLLWQEIWYSSRNTGFGGTQPFRITVSPGGQYRIVATAISVTGLNTNNAVLVDGNTVDTGTSFYPTTLSLDPSQIPPSLIVAGLSFDDKNESWGLLSGGFGLQIWAESGGGGSGNQHCVNVLAAKQSSAAEVAGISVTGTVTWIAGAVAFTGAVEAEIDHTSDSALRLTSEVDHTTDSSLKGTYVKNHSADSLLSGQNSEFHSADTLLQATQNIQHTTDLFIKPPLRTPVLRNLLINTVPAGVNIGNKEVKILGMHGNGIAPSQFNYVLNPQEFVVGKRQRNQVNIIDRIIKKPYEETLPEEELEPAGQILPNNTEFKGFPVYFAPFGAIAEEFVDGWINYAKMSDDPIEENFEETPNAWNDSSGTSWTQDKISPDALSPSFMHFSNGDNPGVPVKEVENMEEWYPASPVTLVQSAGFSKLAGEPANKVVAFDTPPTDGNILVVAACLANASLSSITQGGVTWNSYGTSNVEGALTVLWIGHSLSSADQSLTLNLNSSSYNGAIIIAEYSGVDPAGTINSQTWKTATDSIFYRDGGIVTTRNGLWLLSLGFRAPDVDLTDFTEGGEENHWDFVTEQVGNASAFSDGTRVYLFQKTRQGINRLTYLAYNQNEPHGLVLRAIDPV